MWTLFEHDDGLRVDGGYILSRYSIPKPLNNLVVLLPFQRPFASDVLLRRAGSAGLEYQCEGSYLALGVERDWL